MKTIEIKLEESAYKDIKQQADKHELNVADYIMEKYENQTSVFEKGIMLDDAIDQAIYECEDVDSVEVMADAISTMVEDKVQEVIAYLANK